MPRKRKAARAYRKQNRSVREEIRERYDPESLDYVMLMVANFHLEMTTEAERNAFAEEFPAKFFDLFEFESSVYDQYPATVQNATGSCVFRRWNFAKEYIKAHPPRTRFIPPDLRGVKYIEQHPIMAQARANWWKANGWEMTEAEKRWLLVGPLKPAHVDTVTPPFHPRRTDNPNIITMPAKEIQ